MTTPIFVIEGPAPYGANKSLLVLIEHLQREGHCPAVLVSRKGPFTSWLEQLGVSYYVIGHRFSTYPPRNTLLRRVFFPINLVAFRVINGIAIVRALFFSSRIGATFIHTNIGPCAIGFWIARILRIPHVWHLREFQDIDFGMRYFPSRAAFLRQLSLSSRVICVSKAVQQHFNTPENSVVVYNGVDSRSLCLPSSAKKPRFLFLGRLEATKGAEEVLNAYLKSKLAQERGIELVFAGTGETAYVRRLMAIANDHPKCKIHFLGFVEDTKGLLRDALCVVVASAFEGFGRVTAEAMFNGCLVVGKNSGGTAELLSPPNIQPLGLLYASPDELIAHFDAISSPTFDSEDYVRRAHAYAKQHFSIEGHIDQVLGVYRELGLSV